MKHSAVEGYLELSVGKIWYKLVGEKTQKPPLLVLHGGPGFPHDYLTPLESLATDRQVIFYDQLGCGNSDRPNPISLWTLERFTQELHDVCEGLHLDRFHLLGQSWGAMLALQFTAQFPEFQSKIVSLTLADPFISSPDWLEDTQSLIKELPVDVQQTIAIAEKNFHFHSSAFLAATDLFNTQHVCRLSPKPEAFIQSEQKMGESVYWTMWGPTEFIGIGNLKEVHLVPQLEKLTLPILFICGRYDEARPSRVKTYAELTPHATYKMFEQSSHVPHLEEEAEYIKYLAHYLKAQDTARK